MTITEMLRQEVEMMDKIGFPRVQNLKAAVLEHGEVYELDREASAAVEKGVLKECFANAGKLALYDEDDYTYVEGFAHSGWGFVVHHAWVINAEGKAIEVTWRDGTDDCGFCVGGEQERDESHEDYDEDDESTWLGTCFMCHGTGKAEDAHRTLEGAEYIGIAVEREVLLDTIMRRQYWGVLNSQADLDNILAAREAA